MQVMIESIEQKVLLNGGELLVTTINIKLPDGSYLSAQVDRSAAERILQLANADEPKVVPSFPPPVPIQEEVYGGEDHQGPGIDPDQVIDWSSLPDSDLTPQMKGILAEIGAPRHLPASELVTLVDKISERMMVQASKAPPVGQVQRLQPVRPKTVPKDEMGYPIVPRTVERDPGEMGPGVVDEDGIGQV